MSATSRIDPPAPRLLVLGGTGFVGRTLCEQLVAQGRHRVVVPTRRLAHGSPLQPLPTVELVAADVHDDAQLAQLLGGVDAVVNLVAILHGRAADFQHVHVELPQRLAAACTRAGVRRVVHVSALAVGADAPSLYLRSKSAGESALRGSGLDVTVLRPSVIFGAGDRFLNHFASLPALAPVLPLAGASARFQPVWVADVARAILASLAQPQSSGQTFECAGPQVHTLAELVRLAGRWAGHARPQIALPMVLGYWQARLLEWLPGAPLMSRDNLDSMRVDSVASGRMPGLDALGIQASALAAVAPGYLGAAQGCSRYGHWRALAGRG
ncbi:MAG: complex I NDUFA9 subunit family protein [Rubrivivax sp.]|nr:complex I NDUFA9 subunit family protein [Rubrivivax sp.]